MPEAATAPPPAAAPAQSAPGIVESAPKTSVDPFPGLSAELDDMIGKSGLGTPESEARVARGKKPDRTAPAKAVAAPKADEVKPPETKPETKPEEKPAEKPPEVKPETKPEEKPADKPADQQAVPEDKSKQGPWQRVHAAERRVKELEAQVQQFKTAKPGDDPEKLELKTKFEESEKSRKALEDEMRFLNYERSPEFQRDHYKPYVESWKRAEAAIKDLKIPVEGGEPRAGTIEDLSRIVQAATHEEASAIADALFQNPTKAAFVLGLRDKLREAHHKMEAQKADWRSKGDEREKAWQAEQEAKAKQREEESAQHKELWDQFNASALEKHKDWFVAPEDDPKGAELLKQGFELADLAWSDGGKLSTEQLIALRSAERNKAAAFRYMVHLNDKAKARIADLEKQLKEFEKSEPGQGELRGDDKAQSDDIDAAIARIPRVG